MSLPVIGAWVGDVTRDKSDARKAVRDWDSTDQPPDPEQLPVRSAVVAGPCTSYRGGEPPAWGHLGRPAPRAVRTRASCLVGAMTRAFDPDVPVTIARMDSPGDGFTLEIERMFAAAPARVFIAFSDPGELSKWWGPEGFTIPSVDFEPRVGRGYRIEMQPADGDAFYLVGEFREVDPPTRLAYTFVWEEPVADDVETLVELAFRDLGEATQVSLTQGLFKTDARRALHRDGWTDSFDKLERLIPAQG
jgi:uncharacterized protein YndB with AHSA1/START domain